MVLRNSFAIKKEFRDHKRSRASCSFSMLPNDYEWKEALNVPKIQNLVRDQLAFMIQFVNEMVKRKQAYFAD